MVTFVGTNKSLFSVPLEGMDATVDGSYKDGLILKRDGQGGTSLSGTGHAAATVKTYAVTGSPAAAYGLVLAAPTVATNNYALYTTGAISIGTISAGTWSPVKWQVEPVCITETCPQGGDDVVSRSQTAPLSGCGSKRV